MPLQLCSLLRLPLQLLLTGHIGRLRALPRAEGGSGCSPPEGSWQRGTILALVVGAGPTDKAPLNTAQGAVYLREPVLWASPGHNIGAVRALAEVQGGIH